MCLLFAAVFTMNDLPTLQLADSHIRVLDPVRTTESRSHESAYTTLFIVILLMNYFESDFKKGMIEQTLLTSVAI